MTVCPVSNGYVTDGTKAAAIKQMLDLGMRVTINSDDPAYFPGYMQENLVVAQEEAGLTKAEVVRLARNAFEGAWINEAQRMRYLEILETYASR